MSVNGATYNMGSEDTSSGVFGPYSGEIALRRGHGVVSTKYGFFLPGRLPLTIILSLYAELKTTWCMGWLGSV